MHNELLINTFKEKHNIDFFEAIIKLYEYIDEALLPYVPFKLDDLENIPEEKFSELYGFIDENSYRLISHRETIISNRINTYFDNSFKRCLGLCRRDTTSDVFFVAQTFFDDDKLRDIITKNPHKGWNPLLLINNYKGTIPCIFKPSRSLRERYDFIEMKYLGSNIIGADINIDRLKEYDSIYINEDDILEFYYGLYHPYIWGLIQSRQRRQLSYNYEMSS